MKKYTQSEGKLEVLTGREAQVLHAAMERTGKYQVSNFSEDELEALNADLAEARKQDEPDIEAERFDGEGGATPERES